MPNIADPGWANLFQNIAAGTSAQVPKVAAKGGVFTTLKKGAKRYGPELLGWMLLERYLSGRHQSKLRDIQMEAAERQATMATPESLYYQAALPQAKAEEEAARAALYSQLSGGVIGPTLARGERLIGG